MNGPQFWTLGRPSSHKTARHDSLCRPLPALPFSRAGGDEAREDSCRDGDGARGSLMSPVLESPRRAC